MGLFSNYNKPGPGVAPDAPRKRGLSRLIEILGRDMGSFFKAGMLAFASCIPFVAGAVLAVLSHELLVMIIAGIVGYFSIRLLIRLISRQKFKYFAGYCFFIGTTALICHFVI